MSLIDNPMFSGYDPTGGEHEADYSCPRCDKGLSADEQVYDWDTGNEQVWLCGDCYCNAVFSLLDWERAEMSGDSIKYTEQQLELVKYDPSAMADILYTDTMTAEDVL